MNNYIGQLLERIKSADKNQRDDAIVEMATILEKNSVQGEITSKKDIEPLYPDVSLDVHERRNIVQKIAELIEAGLREPSMYWILSKSSADVALKPLLHLIRRFGDTYDDSTRWQVLVALDNYLTGPNIAPSDWRKDELQKMPGLLSLLEKWHNSTDDTSMKEIASQLITRVQELSQ